MLRYLNVAHIPSLLVFSHQMLKAVKTGLQQLSSAHSHGLLLSCQGKGNIRHISHRIKMGHVSKQDQSYPTSLLKYSESSFQRPERKNMTASTPTKLEIKFVFVHYYTSHTPRMCFNSIKSAG